MTARFFLLSLALALVGCAPPASDVCAKLSADKKTECLRALDAMKGRSSGEYGACSQCIVDAQDDAGLARCRPHCAGMDELLPR
jgi:hypothetical protein